MANTSVLQQSNQYMAWTSKFRIHIYLDALNFTQYVCDADPTTPLTSPQRRVTKTVYDDAVYSNLVDVTQGSPVGTNQYGEYTCLATNLATVQALSYA